MSDTGKMGAFAEKANRFNQPPRPGGLGVPGSNPGAPTS
jgi:hypothetical protein